jgi:transmembrane 9 superfamily protein 3
MVIAGGGGGGLVERHLGTGGVVERARAAIGTVNVVPLSTLMHLLLVWLTVNLPLVVLGSILGRRLCGERDQAIRQRVNPVPRPVPAAAWFAHPVTIAVVAGIAPFFAIFIETYFVFAAFWGYKVYYVYELMLVVLAILTVVTACVAVVATYVLLSLEEHRWHWPAFASGASVALWVFLYAAYYFVFQTRMHGYVQTSFFFGYTGLACLALGIATGTVGFASSSLFVHTVYSSIKGD